ncbi:hypothetical protein [Actinoplanes sp. NPDC049802]|uniref:hypothetical protein n=1 Tax=Actinoplanes sp. NPDC049802 TaxID=3154742 RepID=UPI0034041865
MPVPRAGLPAVPAERAFLLLKPDCLRLGLSGFVERAVEAAGLRVVCRHRVSLSPGDVRHLWSEYDDAGHSLALAFLDRYLTGEPSEVWQLAGPDAFEAARLIKREVRSRHAAGPFANVVHGAQRRGELARQANHLLGRCGACAAPFVSDEPALDPPRPPGLDFRQHADLAALVDELWPLLQDVPADPGPVRLDGGDTGRAIHLGPDREHTLDSTVTALWHALPGAGLRHPVLLALHAGYSGGTPVAVGGRRALRACLRTLREHGIRNCGEGPYRPAVSAI